MGRARARESSSGRSSKMDFGPPGEAMVTESEGSATLIRTVDGGKMTLTKKGGVHMTPLPIELSESDMVYIHRVSGLMIFLLDHGEAGSSGT
jgi:hypothetical protein